MADEVQPVHGVLLAAGGSARFGGEAKQLLPFEGEPLVRRAARVALESGLAGLVAVVGYRAAAVEEALAGLEVGIVHNPRWGEGQSSSVRAGLAAVPQEAAAALFLPCDQPFLTSGVIGSILAAYRDTGGPIVVPVFAGRRGMPVLFDRALFAELARVTGDEGGRQVMRRYPREVVELALESERPLRDLDTWEDYRRATR